MERGYGYFLIILKNREAEEMALTIAAEENPRKNENRQLVETYLKNVVREMHRIDSVTRHMHKEPNRSVEIHAAHEYMRKNPFRPVDKAEAVKIICEMERENKKHISSASFKSKMDYRLGSIGKTRMKAAIAMGAATAVGGVAISNGASPETGLAITSVLGLTYLTVAHLVPSKSNPEKKEKRLQNLLHYTRAKQTLFVLKAMQKQLKAQTRAETKAAVLTVRKLQGASR